MKLIARQNKSDQQVYRTKHSVREPDYPAWLSHDSPFKHP